MEQMTFQELTDELMRLYPEGKYAEALEVVEQNADRFPEQSARTTFWKMCLLSLCGRRDDVISVFRQGLDSGVWWAESQFIDPDLDAVRDLPEFKRLLTESSRKCIEMQAHIKPARTLLVPDGTSRKLPLFIGLHGRNGHNDSNLEYWEVARQKGWLVLSPQSTQALYPGGYCWDNPGRGLEDIFSHVDEIMKTHTVEPDCIIVGGFSQGSGMAIYAALSGKINVRGFLAIGTYWADPSELIPHAKQAKSVRGHFITGEKDHTLDKAREIQNILKENNIQFGEEVHPDLGHEFPADFEKSFDKAIRFILE